MCYQHSQVMETTLIATTDNVVALNTIVKTHTDLEDYGYETYPDFYGMDWDWLDKDDWWTDRKGGYDVTYTQEVIEQKEPISANPEFVKTVNEAKEAFKDWGYE